MYGKYKYTDKEERELLSSIVIIVDTKEKKNSHITDYFDAHNIPYKKKAMSCGDYSFYVPKNEALSIDRDIYFTDEIFVERKNSLEEVSSNFSSGRAEFEKEFSVAKAKKKYLMIENANYFDVLNGNYNTDYNKKSFIGSMHSFNQKYGLELFFMPDNSYSAQFIYNTMYYYFRSLIH